MPNKTGKMIAAIDLVTFHLIGAQQDRLRDGTTAVFRLLVATYAQRRGNGTMNTISA